MQPRWTALPMKRRSAYFDSITSIMNLLKSYKQKQLEITLSKLSVSFVFNEGLLANGQNLHQSPQTMEVFVSAVDSSGQTLDFRFGCYFTTSSSTMFQFLQGSSLNSATPNLGVCAFVKIAKLCKFCTIATVWSQLENRVSNWWFGWVCRRGYSHFKQFPASGAPNLL